MTFTHISAQPLLILAWIFLDLFHAFKSLPICPLYPGADPGGGPRGPGPPPLTLGFEAPKLSIFGPYLIFP